MGKHNGKSRNTGGTRVGQALARRKQVGSSEAGLSEGIHDRVRVICASQRALRRTVGARLGGRRHRRRRRRRRPLLAASAAHAARPRPSHALLETPRAPPHRVPAAARATASTQPTRTTCRACWTEMTWRSSWPLWVSGGVGGWQGWRGIWIYSGFGRADGAWARLGQWYAGIRFLPGARACVPAHSASTAAAPPRPDITSPPSQRLLPRNHSLTIG
jgi:hypothetical protein